MMQFNESLYNVCDVSGIMKNKKT